MSQVSALPDAFEIPDLSGLLCDENGEGLLCDILGGGGDGGDNADAGGLGSTALDILCSVGVIPELFCSEEAAGTSTANNITVATTTNTNTNTATNGGARYLR